MQALTYYRDLAANTMPGSNDIMEVKDAFMNGTAPMAIYSTYILPAVIKEGDPKNVGFVVPTEKNSAVYGMLTSLTITGRAKDRRDGSSRKICHLYGAGRQHCRLGDDVARCCAAGE
ncbi:ABC transporter substrate-binding protein [Escherichia coli]|uniref:ABC transporter substrate-binding protein n=1 Tax=Escherichia coli TaxID=562 RepID=A0A376RJQ1_ECOLX|nr:ABC transporter substrate-binding protein [Escherichia coli]